MIANYHTHTPRCGHARGTEEAYISCALESGLQVLGFSDHTPYGFPEGYYSHMRMFPQELGEYADAVRKVQASYAHQLQIHLGLEAEYYPAFFDDLLLRLRDNGIEYLILGQHWSGNEMGEPYNGLATEDVQRLKKYCYQVMDAMNTGAFTYVAHPDLLNFVGDSKAYETYMRQLCREAKSCDIPLEINLLGLQSGRHYPNEPFWHIAAQEGCKVILGRDAHAPEAFLDTETEQKANQLAETLHIPLLETINLRRL